MKTSGKFHVGPIFLKLIQGLKLICLNTFGVSRAILKASAGRMLCTPDVDRTRPYWRHSFVQHLGKIGYQIRNATKRQRMVVRMRHPRCCVTRYLRRPSLDITLFGPSEQSQNVTKVSRLNRLLGGKIMSKKYIF